MPTTATEIEVAGRIIKVSSPDREIYPASEKFPAVSKLAVVQYYAAVAPGIMNALQDRPTALERWTKGVQPGIKLATGYGDKSSAFYQKRVPMGAPDFVQGVEIKFPSGRNAVEVCVTELATVAWCAQMGTLTFHPWPVRKTSLDFPDELRIDLDPQPGTSFADAVEVAMVAKEYLAELGLVGLPKTSGNRGIHIYIRLQPKWDFFQIRHAAIAFGRELARRTDLATVAWWKEERGQRIFIDYNQNARDRTIASAYSLRPIPGAPVSTPLTWTELANCPDPSEFNLFTVPKRLAELGDLYAELDENPGDLTNLLAQYDADIAAGMTDLFWPPEYPKMPGEPKRVQPSRDKDRPR